MVIQKTQKERIKDIMRTKGNIDNFYAINTRLTLRLGMHIHLLRKEGWNIRTEELKNNNCIYHLIGEPTKISAFGPEKEIQEKEKVEREKQKSLF